MRIPESFVRGGPVPVFIRKPIIQQKVGQHPPSSETPFVHPLTPLALGLFRWSGQVFLRIAIVLRFSRVSGPVFLMKPIVLRFSRRSGSLFLRIPVFLRFSRGSGPVFLRKPTVLRFSRWSGPVFLKKPIILRFSRGGGGVSRPPVPLSRSAHEVFDLLFVHFLVIYQILHE